MIYKDVFEFKANKFMYFRLHVFTDIRPYICLFSTCTEVLSTFPTRKTWAEHQSHYHFVDISWHCQHCPAIFDSLEEFKLHLNEFHATPVSDSVVQLAEKRLPHTIGTVKCPLCLKVPGSTEASYFLHVSKHMESIALGALPREPDEPQETGPDDSDSDISRQGTSERDSYLVEAASQLTSTSPKLAGGELKRDGQDDVVLMNCPFCDYTADSEYWIMVRIATRSNGETRLAQMLIILAVSHRNHTPRPSERRALEILMVQA